MADAPTLPSSAPSRRPKSWWLIRGVVAVAVVVSIGYATLPFWLPPEWVARQLMNQLSTALDRRVRIDRVRLGWIEGMVFEGVTIEDRAGSVVPILARFGRIRCEFRPITSVISGRVREVQFDEPSLFLTVDRDGKLNIDDLAGQEFRGLPSRNFVVRRLTCRVQTPQGLEKVGIESLACRLDHDTGVLRLLAQVWTGEDRRQKEDSGEAGLAVRERMAHRRLSIHAHVTVPRLKRGETLSGKVDVEWDGLSLRDLPLGLVPKLPFEQAEGTSTGRMTVYARPDLGIDFGLNVALHGVRLQRGEEGRWPQLPDAEVRGEGHWDPTTDVLELKSLGYETPAAKLVGTAGAGSSALRIDPQGDVPLELHAGGTVKDWGILYREWPQLEDRIRGAGLLLSGGTEFGLDLTRRRHEDHAVVVIDGARTACRLMGSGRPLLAVIAEVPKMVRVDVVAGRSLPQRIQPRFEGVLGCLSISGQADLTLPVPWSDLASTDLRDAVEDVLPGAQGEIEVYSRQIEETLGLLPLEAWGASVRDCRGPVQVGLSCKPEAGHQRVQLDLITQVDTRIKYGDVLDKPAGQALKASAALVLDPAATGQATDLHLRVDYGRSLLEAGPAGTRLVYELKRPGQGPSRPGIMESVKVDWRLATRVSHVEDLLSLLPRWRAWCEAGVDREVSGTAGIQLGGELLLAGSDRSLRAEAQLVTDRLAIRWDDALAKGPDEPFTVSVSHRDRVVKGEEERHLEVALAGAGGTVWGSWSRSGGGENRVAGLPGDSFAERMRIKAEIADVVSWLHLSPALSRQVDGWDPSGLLVVNADAEVTGRHSRGSFSFDASGATFRIAGSPEAGKLAGVPTKATFQWSHERSSASRGEGLLKITGASARLAGLELASGSATFEIRVADREPMDAALDPEPFDHVGPFSLKLTGLKAEGRVVFDDSLRSVHPRVRRWCDQARVAGVAEWRSEAEARSGGLAIAGTLDAQNVAFTVMTENDALPSVRKTTGVPLSLGWDVVLGAADEGREKVLLLGDAAVRLDGNEASISGTLGARREGELGLAGVEADLTCHVRLMKSRSLAAMIPGSCVNDLDGKAEAWFGLIRDARGTRLGPSRVEFDGMVLGTIDQPIELHGALAVEEGGLVFDQLRCEWGASRGVVSGNIRRQGDGHVGTIGLAMEHVDISDLQGRLKAVSRDPAATQPSRSENRRAMVLAVVDWLRSADLVADAHVDVLEAVLPPKQPIVADAVAARAVVQKGTVKVGFRGLADGGVITGEVVSQTQAGDPVYHLTYTAEDVHPGPLVDGYLRLSFPGMKATGPLTLIDETYQRILPSPVEDNYEVGEGELVIKGGSVTGRAAPRWMTRYLPGLNLARFNFSYMHSWFKKTPMGRVEHQMIFRGPIYNLYMIGYSDPDRRFEYEVGVDFLADFDSKYWAQSGQGRVPLFVKSGLVAEDGSLLDERVNFVSIERLAESIFLGNNPVLTAYHAVRKRVLGQH